MVTATEVREGWALTGQLVGVDEAYSFDGRETDPATGRPVKVEMKPAIKLLVNEKIVKVPFNPARGQSAADLIGAAKKGEVVTLLVRVTGEWSNGANAFLPIKVSAWTASGPAPVDRD